MTLGVLGAIIRPLVSGQGEQGPSSDVGFREASDLSIYRDQINEVDRDLERGLLDESEAEAARIEIKRRMLALSDAKDEKVVSNSNNTVLIVLLSALIPLGTWGLYAHLGVPGMADAPLASRPDPGIPGEAAEAPAEVVAAVERLAKKMQDNPNDVRGWVFLGQSYMSLQRFEEGREAFRQAMSADSKSIEAQTGFAEALVFVNGGRVSVEAEALFRAILESEPLDYRARYYLGLKKQHEGDNKGALQDWVDLVSLAPMDAPWLEAVVAHIERLAGELGIETSALKASPEAAKIAATLTQFPETKEGQEAMIRSMVERLAERMTREPDNLEGWRRLAQAYEVLGETEKAEQAKQRIKALEKAAKALGK
jgi:cytochrome c-type biogenesis protein CcmH